ncbi:hypothetical protein [Pukyongiella litopenaei]|uniref:Uncharacterized protein n=1 Tax=Pukyongiella litopenaei TaxID=2605946 RepID=A0A5C2H2A0_9RHOB|nr:hypothetical protein [Pukyongiella litopenaei]QEP30330.1 hypothetical protein C6Y53_19055 [Pukyongiella litopenaei]
MNDGRYVVRFPGDRTYTAVSKEEYELAKSGTLKRLGRAARDTAQDVAGGAMELLGRGVNLLDRVGSPNPVQRGAELVEKGRELRTANDPLQRINRAVNPGVATVGGALPDIAAGGASSLVRRPLMGLALDSALGAASSPDAPLTGAAAAAAGYGVGAGAAGAYRYMRPGTQKGIQIGNAVIDNSRRQRAAQRAEISAAAREGRDINPKAWGGTADPLEPGIPEPRGRAAGAQVNPSPTYELSEPVLGDVLSSRTMRDRYSFPTTQAQAAIIDTSDPTTFAAARRQDAADFQEWRSRGGISGAVKDMTQPIDNYDDLRATQVRALNKEIMRAMGEPNAVAVTTGNVGKARRAISERFNEIAREAGNLTREEGDNLAERIAGMIDNEADEGARNLLSHFKKSIDDRRAFRGGELSAEELLEVRNQVAKAVKNAYGRDPNLIVGNALRDLEDELDATFFSKLPDDAKQDMADNRFQWGVANTALRTGAATNARGDVNIRSFINAYRQGNRRYKIGYDRTDFARFLDTADAILFKESPDSGTPQGLAPILGAIAEAAGVPGAGIVGNLIR